jgi:hypothetical protein
MLLDHNSNSQRSRGGTRRVHALSRYVETRGRGPSRARRSPHRARAASLICNGPPDDAELIDEIGLDNELSLQHLK